MRGLIRRMRQVINQGKENGRIVSFRNTLTFSKGAAQVVATGGKNDHHAIFAGIRCNFVFAPDAQPQTANRQTGFGNTPPNKPAPDAFGLPRWAIWHSAYEMKLDEIQFFPGKTYFSPKFSCLVYRHAAANVACNCRPNIQLGLKGQFQNFEQSRPMGFNSLNFSRVQIAGWNYFPKSRKHFHDMTSGTKDEGF